MKQEYIFQTPFNQYREYNGRKCYIVEQVDPTAYDYADCGVLWVVQFEDGTQIEAWPEELETIA